MAPIPRKTPSVKSKLLSKEIPFPTGKENARPAAITSGRKLSLTADAAAQLQSEPKIRISLAPKREQRKEIFLKKGRTRSLVESVSAKKTPFLVHHDENIAPENYKRSREATFVADASSSSDRLCEQVRPAVRVQVSKIPRKRGTVSTTENCADGDNVASKYRRVGDPRNDRKLLPLPSKIPRRSRSTSVPIDQTVSQINWRRSASVDVKTRGKRSSSKRQTVPTTTEKERRREQANAESRLSRIVRRKIQVELKKREDNNGRLELTGAGARVRAGASAKSANHVLSAVVRETRLKSSETPVDVAKITLTSPPIIVKAASCLAKAEVAGETEETERCRSSESNPFPAELYLNAEYHNDLPIVEREREESSPRLSEHFLKENMNAEQRRLIVIFMIRLGIHLHHPSFIIYQAVKLFDAAMDRIRVDTMFIQLMALASLWIAIKRQEIFHKIPMAEAMVIFAKELYAGRQDLLIAYERKILLSLDYNVTFADAFSLFNYHLINCKRFVDVSKEITMYLYHCGGYLIDLTLLDEQFCRVSASLIAVTAAELALGLVLDTNATHARPRWLFWRGLLFAGASRVIGSFRDEEIDRFRVLMLRQLFNSGRKHCGFEVVYKKYSRSKYGRISDSLLELANKVSHVEMFNP